MSESLSLTSLTNPGSLAGPATKSSSASRYGCNSLLPTRPRGVGPSLLQNAPASPSPILSSRHQQLGFQLVCTGVPFLHSQLCASGNGNRFQCVSSGRGTLGCVQQQLWTDCQCVGWLLGECCALVHLASASTKQFLWQHVLWQDTQPLCSTVPHRPVSLSFSSPHCLPA
jgi:hypothetical protein